MSRHPQQSRRFLDISAAPETLAPTNVTADPETHQASLNFLEQMRDADLLDEQLEDQVARGL